VRVSDGGPETERQTATVEVVNRLGLHARAAALLAETAQRFDAEVLITKDGQTVNGKSIMELLLLAATQGSTLEVTTVGADATGALAAVRDLILDRFRERE
jgi:phosphocarrier protein